MSDLKDIIYRKVHTSIEDEASKRSLLKEMQIKREETLTELDNLSSKLVIANRNKELEGSQLDIVIKKLREELNELKRSMV